MLFQQLSPRHEPQIGISLLHPSAILTPTSVKHVLTPSDVHNWITKHSLPAFFELSPRSYNYLYTHPKPFMVLFIQNRATHEEMLYEYEQCTKPEYLDQELPLVYCDLVDFKHSGYCRALLLTLQPG